MGLQTYLLLMVSVLLCSGILGSSNITSQETSLSEIEEMRDDVANLTLAQNLVWEQQSAYEQEVRLRNKKDEEWQETRTQALEQQQHLLKEIWATLSRKLKSLTKKNHKDNHIGRVQPKDCADLYLDGEHSSGIYKIWPIWLQNNTGFPVYCDMETAGGGWTVIHRWGKYDFPKNYFRRPWDEYKNGFGDLESAFWLGNDMISALTRQGAYAVRFDMTGDRVSGYSVYNSFWIENESQKYKLHVERYEEGKNESTSSTQDIGDIFINHHGSTFSTFDRIQFNPYGECSNNLVTRPGWWYKESCPLNKVFHLPFADTTNQQYTYSKSEMKIRPVNFQIMKETP